MRFDVHVVRVEVAGGGTCDWGRTRTRMTGYIVISAPRAFSHLGKRKKKRRVKSKK